MQPRFFKPTYPLADFTFYPGVNVQSSVFLVLHKALLCKDVKILNAPNEFLSYLIKEASRSKAAVLDSLHLQ